MNKPVNIYIFIVYMFMMTIIVSGLAAQDKSGQKGIMNSDQDYIHWVCEFPVKEDESKSKGFFHRIGRAIFGNKPVVIIKPVAILAHNMDEYWVLDQKIGSAVQVEKQKGTVMRLKSLEGEQLSSLVGICEVPGMGFLITDSRANKIFTIHPNTKRVTQFEVSVELHQPTGLAFLKAKNEIWVLETKEHRIAIFNKKGELIRTIGKRGNEKGSFNYPTHIWIDDNGLVYIVDSMNFRVQILDSEGRWVSMFGEVGDATGYMARPKGIAVDSQGNIYIADALFHTVQIFDHEGKFLYNFGKQGREIGDFWMPMGIYIDRDDHIYVADTYNSRVQVFQFINRD